MSGDQSISWWIQGLKAGDEEAAERLWERYFERIVRLANARLKNAPRRVADEEDVAVSVFRSLCAGAQRGRFDRIEARDDLWRLIATITSRKTVDQIRHFTSQKRGGGKVRGESLFARRSEDGPRGMEALAGNEPTPEFLCQLAEERERLIRALGDESLRRVALLKLEGFTNGEISERMELTPRSIERKLGRIRQRWVQELENDGTRSE